MNLKEAAGKVPVYTGSDSTPYILVDFPTHQEFLSLYYKKARAKSLPAYWNILKRRSQGMTLTEAGFPHAITKERVRQIEAKFLRIFREAYFAKESSSKKG